MIPRPVRKAVLGRASTCCERCGVWLDVPAGEYSLQHRRGRAMGGSRLIDTNAAVNLAAMCGSANTGCHGWAEANPLEAAEDGWRVRQGQDPATIPIQHHQLGPVLLGDDYSYVVVPA